MVVNDANVDMIETRLNIGVIDGLKISIIQYIVTIPARICVIKLNVCLLMSDFIPIGLNNPFFVGSAVNVAADNMWNIR